MLTFKTPNDIDFEEFEDMTPEQYGERFPCRNITLTNEDANLLVCYILMTTQHRREVAESWAKLAEDKDDDGVPLFPNAQSNSEFWEMMSARLESIKKAIDDAPWIERP